MLWLLALVLIVGGVFVLPAIIEVMRPARIEALKGNAYPKPVGQYADLPSGRTYYRWHGQKGAPVIICVHGLSTPSFVWELLVSKLASQPFQILTYDLYGRGYSGSASGKQTPEFFNRQLCELLDDQGITAPVTLMGYSMGGAVTTAFTSAHPDRVERAILLAPGGLGHDLGQFAHFATAWPLIGDALFKMLGGYFLRKGSADEKSQRDVDIDSFFEQQCAVTYVRGFAPAVLSSMRYMLGYDQSEDHETIARNGTPLLAIWGELDPIIPISGKDKLAHANPDARQIVITDGDHGITYTHADDIVSALLQSPAGNT